MIPRAIGCCKFMQTPQSEIRNTMLASLTVSRDFPFPAERVYDAWLDPQAVGRWLFATPDGVIERAELDPRVGGRFVVNERRGEMLAEHFGEFLELDRPRRIMFTFATSGEEKSTRVTVEITPTLAGCRLTLSHDLAPEWQAYADRARQGWTLILDGLASTLVPDREVVSWRVFDAPREQVFRAFSDPARFARWWGPADSTNTIREFDLRPGGKWRIIMHSPGGVDFDNESVFVDVVRPARIVYDHLEPIHKFRMTMTLLDRGPKTMALWRMTFDSAEECDRVKQFVTPANEQNFDRLAAVLAADPDG
jgi:uncharacterized protein YndB with AHSA1/START domain